MKTIFCFGELLLRMSPLPAAQWIREAQMPVFIGGAELNVATALAKWQQPVQYGTALPRNALSADVCSVLAEKGIDVSAVHFSGSRIGIYYLTQGTDLKHAGVIYDRAHSSFSELQPGTLDWDKMLHKAYWFHFSAISPAVSHNAALVCREALAAASAKGIPVSIDLNYRARLWQYGKEPEEIMPELAAFCDVIMGNIWSANSLLGTPLDARIHDRNSKDAYLQHATQTAQAIMRQHPKCKTVAQTFRFDNNGGIRYYAALNNAQQQYVSKEYNKEKIIDKVGSGDCFMAGLIYGMCQPFTPQQTVDFAAAAAIGKMNETGDATQQTVDMIAQTMKGT